MSYQYFATGSIYTFGCARVEKDIFVYYKWGERSVVYLKYKAVKGLLERVAIKKVHLNYKLGRFTPVYQDNMNSLYNEEELISEYEARELVQDYIDLQNERIAANIRSCGSNTI